MGKRKQGQRRDDSSSMSSDAKRRRETSRPSDGTPWEVFRDAVIQLKDAIQVKMSTEEIFKRKFQKLKEKRKKDKFKHKEELRILKENFRILRQGHEDLKLKIQEMRKEGCAEVDQYKASPSQRSQLIQSTRFRLVIENSVSRTIYKNETVETEDGGGHIKVAMYDGGNPIAPDHPLASVKVDLVVIEGRFNEPKRDSWSKEDFGKSMITPREGMTRLVKNGTFDLIGGNRDHPGAIIMDNSQKKEVKLGVMIAVHTEERVLEGVSNPFKVQEAKTKSSKKKGIKLSPPVQTQNLVQPTSTHITQHDRGKQKKLPTNDAAENNQLNYPSATVPLTIEGNGQNLNVNGQQIPAQILGQPTSAYSIQHGQVYSWAPPSTQNQLCLRPPLPPTEWMIADESSLACGQDQYTSFSHGSSEFAYQNPRAYASLTDTQLTFSSEDVSYLNAQTQLQETYGSFRCGQVLLQWDKPHVELTERWNFFDQLMPLYNTKPRFYRESFPSTSLMDKAHKFLASISSGDSVWNMITSVTSQAMKTHQRRGVLTRSIEPYDSDQEPPCKKRRNAKYVLRFVNRVCNDYYTYEQIKSDDGTFLKVALYDENNLVVTSGPLSSACVEVVLLHGDFNSEGQDYWTSEEFSTCLVHPQSAKEPSTLGGDRILALNDGEADLGNVNFQTSSFHARTGKFKMGVVITKNVREESVQEGTTRPFLVRVRLGEEPNCDRITSLEALLRVRTKLPNQVCGALERDPKENVSASSVLHDQSLQEISVLGTSTATEQPPEPWKGVELTAPSALLKERKSAEDINHSAHDRSMATAAGVGGGGDSDGRPMSERARLAHVPQQEPGLNCPRCDSTNTKFCYFNNYNLAQPRHFCHACRRYWTRGGTLRSVRGYRRHTKLSDKPKDTATRAAAMEGIELPNEVVNEVAVQEDHKPKAMATRAAAMEGIELPKEVAIQEDHKPKVMATRAAAMEGIELPNKVAVEEDHKPKAMASRDAAMEGIELPNEVAVQEDHKPKAMAARAAAMEGIELPNEVAVEEDHKPKVMASRAAAMEGIELPNEVAIQEDHKPKAMATRAAAMKGIELPNEVTVQEDPKDEDDSKEKGKKPSPPIPTRNLVQPTSTYVTEHDKAAKSRGVGAGNKSARARRK
ncbi:uncharacterized protein LOC124660971 isoform X3 [Lolium rigidum]|uniref:uncharacterized protein LOC124660971 isoform X3 n=1 Tax=Lolium rigidum TaxID=89674 RepID=UPI001F5CA2CA|nr:uncharacterized protein LOC124660971 isoform X3 [Lolium rigidum]